MYLKVTHAQSSTGQGSNTLGKLLKMARRQLTLFQFVDSQNPSTKVAEEDDRNSSDGFSPAFPPGTLREENSPDSEGLCETAHLSVPGN